MLPYSLILKVVKAFVQQDYVDDGGGAWLY
jgi:hypothetical protein